MIDPTLGTRELGTLAAYGTLGALAGLLSAKTSRLRMPRLVRDDEDGKEIDPGFVAPLFLGAFAAVIGAGQQDLAFLPCDGAGPRILVAAAYGFAAAVLGPAVINSILAVVLKLPAIAKKLEEKDRS